MATKRIKTKRIKVETMKRYLEGPGFDEINTKTITVEKMQEMYMDGRLRFKDGIRQDEVLSPAIHDLITEQEDDEIGEYMQFNANISNELSDEELDKIVAPVIEEKEESTMEENRDTQPQIIALDLASYGYDKGRIIGILERFPEGTIVKDGEKNYTREDIMSNDFLLEEYISNVKARDDALRERTEEEIREIHEKAKEKPRITRVIEFYKDKNDLTAQLEKAKREGVNWVSSATDPGYILSLDDYSIGDINDRIREHDISIKNIEKRNRKRAERLERKAEEAAKKEEKKSDEHDTTGERTVIEESSTGAPPPAGDTPHEIGSDIVGDPSSDGDVPSLKEDKSTDSKPSPEENPELIAAAALAKLMKNIRVDTSLTGKIDELAFMYKGKDLAEYGFDGKAFNKASTSEKVRMLNEATQKVDKELEKEEKEATKKYMTVKDFVIMSVDYYNKTGGKAFDTFILNDREFSLSDEKYKGLTGEELQKAVLEDCKSWISKSHGKTFEEREALMEDETKKVEEARLAEEREEAERKAKEEAEARVKAEAEARAKAEAEARAKAEAEAREKAEAERKAKEAEEARKAEEATKPSMNREDAIEAEEEWFGDLDKAIEYLQECKNNGQNVYIDFNSHKLYSCDITVDGTYLEVFGLTKEEMDEWEKADDMLNHPDSAVNDKDLELARKTKELLEARAKEREEVERKVKEEAEARAKAEAERKAKEEAEAREKAEAKEREEAERKAKEEAEARVKAEAERKAKEAEEAAKKASEEKPLDETKTPTIDVAKATKEFHEKIEKGSSYAKFKDLEEKFTRNERMGIEHDWRKPVLPLEPMILKEVITYVRDRAEMSKAHEKLEKMEKRMVELVSKRERITKEEQEEFASLKENYPKMLQGSSELLDKLSEKYKDEEKAKRIGVLEANIAHINSKFKEVFGKTIDGLSDEEMDDLRAIGRAMSKEKDSGPDR